MKFFLQVATSGGMCIFSVFLHGKERGREALGEKNFLTTKNNTLEFQNDRFQKEMYLEDDLHAALLTLPTTPGFGLELNREALHLVRPYDRSAEAPAAAKPPSPKRQKKK